MPLDNRFLDRLSALTVVARDEPMSRHTTLHIGGPAAAYTSITDPCRLGEVVRLAKEWEAPLFILGAGSNLLVSDAGLEALVVETWANAQTLQISSGPPQDLASESEVTASVYAGTPLPRLAHQAAAAGLSGLEWSVGVPGTAGGGVVNNAGAHGTEMSQVLKAVRVHDGREERVLRTEELGYSYRRSNFRTIWAADPPVVLQAEIALKPAPEHEIRARTEEFTAHRRNTQPSQRSIGSIFKNPPERASGWLIEQAGLKGRRVGDAEVSEKHGNFIVNRGHARAADIFELIQIVRSTVKETFGVELELEIQRVGNFD